ncbi:MAG TPA: hypothetical protein VG328_13850 [Stellaceae bacterium]|jgi:hypothetical protein|nr:hypothetical protein [Stellaceae bacterium]
MIPFLAARLRPLILAVAGIIALAAPALAAGDATPDQFLATIYRHYEGRNAKGIDIYGKKVLSRYFEPSLVALIAADEAAAAKRGDAPELDGDPFVDAQDWEISNLKIATKMDGTEKAISTVSFRNFKEPHSVSVRLIKLPAGWRIADITWPDGSLRGLYSGNR